MVSDRRDTRATILVVTDRSQRLDQFAYFTIRMRLPAAGSAPPPVCGVIEDLATGRKSRFDSADELLRLVRSWSDPGSSGVPHDSG